MNLKISILAPPVTVDALPNFSLANKDDEYEDTAKKIQSVNNLEEVEGEGPFLISVGVKIGDECMGSLQYPEEAQNNKKFQIQCLSESNLRRFRRCVIPNGPSYRRKHL